jgi:hypothetical protein
MKQRHTIDPEFRFIILPAEPPPNDDIPLSRPTLELDLGLGFLATLLDVGFEILCSSHHLSMSAGHLITNKIRAAP